MEVRRRVNFPPALPSLELNSKHCYWIKEEYCGQAGLMAGVFSWTTDLLYWVQCILEDIDLLFMWKTQIKANVLVVKSKRSKFWTYPKQLIWLATMFLWQQWLTDQPRHVQIFPFERVSLFSLSLIHQSLNRYSFLTQIITLSPFTHPRVVPNLYAFSFCVWNSEGDVKQNDSLSLAWKN